MAYELAKIETPAPQVPQAPSREEKVVDMYDNAPARLAKALSKVTGATTTETAKNDASVITDSVVEADPSTGVSRPLSPQLAALARKEQKFREEQKKLKAAELALDAERKEIAELRALKAKIAAGDYSEIDKLVDYEKLTQHKLGQSPENKDLETLKSDLAALKADREKDIHDRFESAVNQRRVAVKTLIASGDEYSAIKELRAEDAVVQHILDTWENDEIELSPEEAAREVEAALLEKANQWAKLSRPPKTETEPAVVEEPKKELPPLKTGMKTLTNNMAATGEIKPSLKPLHLMSEQERYQEARRRYEEKIKSGMR